MKAKLLVALGLCLCVTATSAINDKAKSKPKTAPKATGDVKVTQDSVNAAPFVMKDFRDTLSYALGMNVIKTIRAQNLDINSTALLRALMDGFGQKNFMLTDEQIASCFRQFDQQRQANSPQPKENGVNVEENKAKGKAFLAENAKKPGVVTTASGLQYKVVKEGSGAKPSAMDKVKVHYKGTLINGKEFDSSYKRGEPIEFPLSGVIRGWTEGVQLMSVGSTYEFYIPAELAYGDRSMGPDLPGGSTLIFQVELLDIPAK